MPELPEVETIKNCLLPRLAGRKFTGVSLLWTGIVRHPSPEEFCRRLAGQTIEDIRRRGKYLLFHLDGETLIMHLKMTGALLIPPSSAEPENHTRAIFYLDDATQLHFRDQRKFGALWLVKDALQVVGKLGPEPMTRDFTPEVLSGILKRHRIPVKALICDQNLIAGIGNMYADEALFAARIYPEKKSDELSDQETIQLHKAIQEVLSAGIRQGGASVSTYRHPDGGEGSAHQSFCVAHRYGKICPRCGTTIERMRIRGRGTYFCPRCQQR